MNEEQLECMRTDIALHGQSIKNHDSLLKVVTDDIRQIKEKLLGRPSWIVMIIITGLASLCGVLITCLWGVK